MTGQAIAVIVAVVLVGGCAWWRLRRADVVRDPVPPLTVTISADTTAFRAAMAAMAAVATDTVRTRMSPSFEQAAIAARRASKALTEASMSMRDVEASIDRLRASGVILDVGTCRACLRGRVPRHHVTHLCRRCDPVGTTAYGMTAVGG